jgi:hypothetical protein
MIYTALAMAGTFSFAATESLRSICCDLRGQDHIFSSPQDYYLEFPAEEPALSAAKGGGFLPRGGTQRLISPWGLPQYGTRLAYPSLIPVSKPQYFDVKHTILVKLRI